MDWKWLYGLLGKELAIVPRLGFGDYNVLTSYVVHILQALKSLPSDLVLLIPSSGGPTPFSAKYDSGHK